MRGNLHVRFLEGWASAMAPGYSTTDLCATHCGQAFRQIYRFSRARLIPVVEKSTENSPQCEYGSICGAQHGSVASGRCYRERCVYITHRLALVTKSGHSEWGLGAGIAVEFEQGVTDGPQARKCDITRKSHPRFRVAGRAIQRACSGGRLQND